MTKYIQPDDTLNIYYKISEDTKDIEHISVSGEEDDISNLDNLQNVKKIQWSPDKNEHLNETFEFDIEGFGTQKVFVGEIPEESVFHYPIVERNDDKIIEKISDEHGTTFETTNISNNFYRNFAEKADGISDYIELTQLNDWGSTATVDSSIFFTVRNDGGSADQSIMGVFDIDDADSTNDYGYWICLNTRSDGDLTVFLRDDDKTGDNEVHTNANNLSSKTRICINIKGNGADDIEVWYDGVKQSTTIESNAGIDNPRNFNDQPFVLFSRRKGDAVNDQFFEGVLDNIIFTDTSVDKDTIETDYENQPWS